MASAEVPEITGQPVIDTPPLPEWPINFASAEPDLTEPTANRLYDLHGRIGGEETSDLILSTSGNHLRDRQGQPDTT